MKKNICKMIAIMILLMGMVVFPQNQTVKATENKAYVLYVHDQENIAPKIQNALKAGHKYIVIPKGEYYCTGVNLNGTDGVTIKATSETTVKQYGSDPILCVANSYTASNITIKGGTWDGGNVETPVMRFYGDINGITLADMTITGTADCGVRFNNAKSVKIENTVVQNCGSYAVLCDNVENLTITDSKMNSSKNGLTLRTCTGLLSIAKSEFMSNSGYGIYASDCGDITMLEVTASENNAGVRLENNVGKVSMKSIYAKSNKEIGIKLYKCSGQIAFSRLQPQKNGNSGLVLEECTGNATIYKSYAYSNGNIGIDVKKCAYVKFNGCLVKYNSNYGINVDGNTRPDNASWALKIVGTTSQKNSDIGIRIVNMPDKNNKINIDASTTSNDNKNAGFYAENLGFVIFNKVSAKSNKGFGINANQCKSVTVASTNVSTNSDIGVRLNACDKSKVIDLVTQSNSKSGILVKSSKNCTVINATISDNKDYGFNFNDVTGTNKLSGIAATGNANSGFLFTNAQGVTLDSACSSLNNGAHGIYVADSKVTLNGVDVESNFWCGVSVTGTSANLTVNGGTFMSNGTRPDQYEDDDNLCAGIGIYGGATAKIVEATCNKNHGCGVTAAGAEDGSLISTISVYGCTASENEDHGIGARPYGKINVTKSSNNIENFICNNKHTGFILNDHCTADYVEYCTITRNGKAGISISENSSADKICNNNVNNNTEDGIHVSESSKASIQSCEIVGNVQAGIGIYSNSTVAKIESCNINENEHYGICVDTSTVTDITNDSILNNLWAGILVRNGSKVNNISGTTSQGNKTYGLYVSNGSSANVVSCNFNKNTNDGIRVSDSNSVVSVKKSKMNNNEGNGVTAASGAKISELTNCTVSGNAGYGIYVSEKANLIASGTNVTSSGKDGIRITGSGAKATITKGSTSKGKANGLVVTGNATLSVNGTKIAENAGYGIYVANGANAKLIKNLTVSDSGADGIRITGKKTTATLITNVNSKNSTKCGLVLTDNAVLTEMSKSTFIGNGSHGVAVYKGTTSNKVSDLTCSGNSLYQIYVEDGATTCLSKQK